MSSQQDMPRKILELDVKCPVCGNNAKLVDYVYRIPYYNDIVISILSCHACGFVHRDVVVLGGGAYRKIIYKVEKPGDENALVIRSSFTKIEIPELGLSVEPGAHSQGYITTIEGIIQDFIDVTRSLCESGEIATDKCNELMSRLEKAKNAEIPFTIILYDYTGTSDVVSEKTRYEELKEGLD